MKKDCEISRKYNLFDQSESSYRVLFFSLDESDRITFQLFFEALHVIENIFFFLRNRPSNFRERGV